MILRLLAIAISLLLTISCHEGGGVSRRKEISIAYLKSLCRGEHYLVVDDYRLRGVVVANSWLGEFPASVVVVDESGGVEISIESPNLDKELPICCEVEILCSGLMLARIGGKVALGARSDDDFPLANIDGELLSHYIRPTGRLCEFSPKVKHFDEICNDDISSLCRFDGVRICDEERGLKWCDTLDGELVTTYRTLVDADGNRFEVCTLPTCSYALEDIPQNEISVAGIVDYADNRHFIRIANKSFSIR
jgi:hypothetical protein